MYLMESGFEVEESPVDRLLREQARLQTPVADFSKQYDEADLEENASFRSLIPLENPKPGEQFAFEVDLDRCSGCKACVTACHSLNGLDDFETWRDVGQIQGESSGEHYQQTVTTACHHCVDPGCLEGCPVNAYSKDPLTGVVLHLDDQCIGCQYCVLKCPYDVPKYNERLGIVRKCDMCHSRLAVGESPACVQACPTEAIRITTVSIADISKEAHLPEAEAFLPDAPHQDYTVPTTSYISKREIPVAATAVDAHDLRPQHAHLPLVWMLTLTQVSVGLVTAISFFGQANNSISLIAASALSAVVGMTASFLHLGRPLQAWRAFLGLTHSWLSREIFAFSAYAGLLTLACALDYLSSGYLGLTWKFATVTGLIAVFTSVMIYHDTRREFWRFDRTAARFFGTVGISSGVGFLLLNEATVGSLLLVGSLILKTIPEVHILTRAKDSEVSPDRQSARIQIKIFPRVLVARWLTAILGMTTILIMNDSPFAIAIGCGLLFLGELSERFLYFTAVFAPKMPGGVRA